MRIEAQVRAFEIGARDRQPRQIDPPQVVFRRMEKRQGIAGKVRAVDLLRLVQRIDQCVGFEIGALQKIERAIG